MQADSEYLITLDILKEVCLKKIWNILPTNMLNANDSHFYYHFIDAT